MDTKPQRYVPSLHYSRLTSSYDFFMRLAGEAVFKKRLIEIAGLQNGQSILDLGCGTATLATMVKKEYPGAQVAGLDYDREALALALHKFQRARVDIALIRGTAFQLPFASRSFDRVLTSLVFHHLTTENKRLTLQEVLRILHPGGEFYLADFGVPHNFPMRLIACILRRIEDTEDNLKGRLPEMMVEAGFQDVAQIARFSTMFGTLAVYRGKKPGQTDSR